MCRMIIVFIAFACIHVNGQNQSSGGESLVAKGQTLTKAGGGYSFTEGPAADAHGNVFFTDQPNDKIYRWTTDGKIALYMEGAGRSNGLFVDRKGNLISCADLDNQLLQIDKGKKVKVLIKDFEGKKLNGPNDLWIDPKGGIYLTDPFYKRDYWTRTDKEIEKENVYYLSPDRKTLTVAATDFIRPNGIVGSHDGKRLFVADINDNKIYVYSISTDGSLADRKVFTDMGSDGMTTDERGNVYLTGKGVTVFDSTGKQIEHIDVPEPWTANVSFGGKDFKMLFITASKSVYTLGMNVKGAR